ncbi:MAG: sigma-70 family RNA polymerase sigma factor [Actinomycetia bacterium]|nr:sigma-70 family RNA polymerase sigma factor [Actinomycetes bacterium]
MQQSPAPHAPAPERPTAVPSRSLRGKLTDEEFCGLSLFEDEEWLGELFLRYESRLVGCAHRMVGPAEVEDAAQEINERIVRGLPKFRGDSAVGTWIYAVARNTCLDVRRRRKPMLAVSDEVLDYMSTDVGPEDVFDISILGCRTALAVRDLPEGQAAVLLLRLGEGLSTAETAAELGITGDAVKAKLRRARQHLRTALAQQISCPQCGPGTYAITGITTN